MYKINLASGAVCMALILPPIASSARLDFKAVPVVASATIDRDGAHLSTRPSGFDNSLHDSRGFSTPAIVVVAVPIAAALAAAAAAAYALLAAQSGKSQIARPLSAANRSSSLDK